MPVYKDNKRNTWYTRYYVEDLYGNKKQKTKSGFKTKSEALQYERTALSTKNLKANNITFQDLYDVYIKDKSQYLKFQSIRAIKSKFSLHILPYFKNYKISKINNEVYIDWKAKIITKGFGYKYNSSLHGSMVSILNYAMKFYDLEHNIASKIGNFSKKDYIPKFDFWTYEEFTQFINVVNNEVYYALFRTLYFTGMRLGECLALNWADLDKGFIYINKSLSKEKRNGEYVLSSPKTKHSIRKISIDKKTLEILKNLKKYYKNYIGFNDNWFIFGGLHSLSQSTVTRRKNSYCEKAKIKQIKMHEFRHSHASLMVSIGMPITALSKRLGHSDTNMTLNIYSHFIQADEDKAINLIEKLEDNS